MLKINDLTEHWLGSNVYLEVDHHSNYAHRLEIQTVPGLSLQFEPIAQRDLNDYRLVTIDHKVFTFDMIRADQYFYYV